MPYKRVDSRQHKKSVLSAVGLSGILFIAGSSVGFTFYGASPNYSDYMLPISDVGFRGDFWDLLTRDILAQNIGACLLLFSGIATFGFSSIIAISLAGIFTGAMAQAGIRDIGVGNLVADVFLYAPLEFSGILIAAAAGLLPMTGKICQVSLKIEPSSYAELTIVSLKLLAVAVFFIIVSAVIEAALIVLK